MKSEDKVKIHDRAIELLEAEKFWKRMLINKETELNGFAGTFTGLRIKILNKIEANKRLIRWIQVEYFKTINRL